MRNVGHIPDVPHPGLTFTVIKRKSSKNRLRLLGLLFLLGFNSGNSCFALLGATNAVRTPPPLAFCCSFISSSHDYGAFLNEKMIHLNFLSKMERKFSDLITVVGKHSKNFHFFFANANFIGIPDYRAASPATSASAIIRSLDKRGTLFCPPNLPCDFMYSRKALAFSALILSGCKILPSIKSR